MCFKCANNYSVFIYYKIWTNFSVTIVWNHCDYLNWVNHKTIIHCIECNNLTILKILQEVYTPITQLTHNDDIFIVSAWCRIYIMVSGLQNTERGKTVLPFPLTSTRHRVFLLFSPGKNLPFSTKFLFWIYNIKQKLHFKCF